MMKFIGLFIVLNFSCCFAQEVASGSSIIGHWKAVRTEYFDQPTSPNGDGNGTRMVFGGHDWLVEKDSICLIDYPCELLSSFNFNLRNDSIFVDSNHSASYIYHVSDSSLIISHLYFGYIHETDYFVRESMDDAVLNQLIKSKINPKCLMGKLKFDCDLPYGNKGEGVRGQNSAEINKIQKKLKIKREVEAITLFENRTVILKFNGEKKEFKIDYIEWDAHVFVAKPKKGQLNNLILTISPGDWWKGEDFSFRYMNFNAL